MQASKKIEEETVNVNHKILQLSAQCEQNKKTEDIRFYLVYL